MSSANAFSFLSDGGGSFPPHLAAWPESQSSVPGVVTSFPQPFPRLRISSPLKIRTAITLSDFLWGEQTGKMTLSDSPSSTSSCQCTIYVLSSGSGAVTERSWSCQLSLMAFGVWHLCWNSHVTTVRTILLSIHFHLPRNTHRSCRPAPRGCARSRGTPGRASGPRGRTAS